MPLTSVSRSDKERIIMSLGGSLVIPDEIDVSFLKEFRALILANIERNKRFVIVLGGGKTCRKYQAAGREIADLGKRDLDWIGIHTNNFNAEFMRITYGAHAHPRVGRDPREHLNFTEDVLFWGALAPGHSSDYDAVEVARRFGAKRILNLSNIDYAYDKDPKKYPDARPIKDISWGEYRALIPSEWDPGLNSPFDPMASSEAERLGLDVVIMNGKNLSTVQRCLDGEPFEGTLIHGETDRNRR